MRRALLHLAALAFAAVLVAFSFSACSIGQGQGAVSGELNVPDCWSGAWDLQPDFFAAVPYRESLQIRIQNGGDFQTFSDGLSILIENVNAILGTTDADGGSTSELNRDLLVSLPPSVVPPGVPITPNADPARIHIAVYLQRTCRTQNVALYALDSVSLNASGSCSLYDDAGQKFTTTCPDQLPDGTPTSSNGDGGAIEGGADASASDASADTGAVTDAAPTSADGGASGASGASGGAVAHSTIKLYSLFNNDVEESSAAKRLNWGEFDLYLGDPRDSCPGGIGPPPPCRGHLTGYFKFYFERGRPAQPFP